MFEYPAHSCRVGVPQVECLSQGLPWPLCSTRNPTANLQHRETPREAQRYPSLGGQLFRAPLRFRFRGPLMSPLPQGRAGVQTTLRV